MTDPTPSVLVPVVLCLWHLPWETFLVCVNVARDGGLAASLARNTRVLIIMYTLANENVRKLETVVSVEVNGPLTIFTYLLSMLYSENVWPACLRLFPRTPA